MGREHPAERVRYLVKKDVKDETDNRVSQFKKKAKELRILDAKTAQNLLRKAITNEMEMESYCEFPFVLSGNCLSVSVIKPNSQSKAMV
ncbi:hypothetical protein PAMP_023183 [Pampus punctatissimus]